MNRRLFLRALAALPLVGSVPALAAYRRRETLTVDIVSVLGWKPEDIITLDRYRREHKGKRCFLDDEDVTNVAFMCLPGEDGWIVGHNRDYPTRGWHTRPDGKIDCIATGRTFDRMPSLYETRYGKVEIREAPKSADVVPALRRVRDAISELRITVPQ